MSSKNKYLDLPIEKKDFGYIQKNHYHHPDLYDEAMTELTSPFASLVATGTKIFTFVLLGDQNAGKSTFLHSFTAKRDKHWYDLAREIPILSSNFINTRFLENTDSLPLDELPFLDTDIARATILLLREDFEYFLHEHHLQIEQLANDIRYIIIQFIEIGGDHLDSIMDQSHQSSKLSNIFTQSINLLKSSLKTIYFINATTLCYPGNTIDLNQFSLLLKRFQYLNEIFPSSHEILCYLTRSEEIQYNQKIFAEKIKHFYQDIDKDANSEIQLDTLPKLLHYYLNLYGKLSHWRINCLDVYVTFHLGSDGTLNMTEIMNTLVRCFQRQMMARASDIESYIFYYLLDYHEKLSMQRNDIFTPLWISQDAFVEYLENRETHEIPETLLLQKFPIVLQKLVRNGFGIFRQVGDILSFTMTFQSQSGAILGIWYATTSSDSVVPEEFRFPLFKPIMTFIKEFFNHELPVDFWLTGLKFHWTENLLLHFKDILTDLTIIIAEQWSKLPKNNILKSKEWNRLCLLLEDWIMGETLVNETNTEPINLKFPINIPITEKSIGQLSKEEFKQKIEMIKQVNIKNVLFKVEK